MQTNVEPTLELLELRGVLTNQQSAHLQASIRARANIVVCGSGVALKHTLLRALAGYAASAVPGERIIVVSGRLEGYALPDTNLVALQFDEDHPFETVFRTAIRMNPDRIVIDEPLKGPSTYDVLRALVNCRGSLVTHNAAGPIVRARLRASVGQHPDGAERVDDLLTQSIDVIVDVKQRGPHPEPRAAISIQSVLDTASAN